MTITAATIATLLTALKALQFVCENQPTITFDPRTTILISLDGARSDYLSRGVTPTIASIAKQGIHAPHMTPSFPTLTWPNHYTLTTGLYPSTHGIIGNLFLDPNSNDTFDYMNFTGQRDPKWWNAGEPIWVACEREGIRTGNVMWPGGATEIRGVRASFYREWDWRVDAFGRIDLGVRWLLQEERPVLLVAYLGEVDHAGHMYGPDSPQVDQELQVLDSSVKRLLDGIEAVGGGKKWHQVVNVVIVSDHGMGEGNTRERFVFLDDFVDASRFEIVDDVVVHVFPRNLESIEELYGVWKRASLESGKWNVWKREDVPREFRYSGNERIGPIVVVPESGWAVSKRVQQGTSAFTSKPFEVKGMHGYNNSHPDMRAIFVAGGPAFKKVEEPIPPFENVEVYGLLAGILKIKNPASTSGTFALNKYLI
ncbi:UNVERIFIED_CONTAM: hypothetical protein HDU68_006378 [Siphonaria sp. JEL0065]|nr:hypothetical protein HDU68_006378 [Siphonaria sp. JEL0065]